MPPKRKFLQSSERLKQKKAKIIEVDLITPILAKEKLDRKDINNIALSLKDPQLTDILQDSKIRKKLCKSILKAVGRPKLTTLYELINYTINHGYYVEGEYPWRYQYFFVHANNDDDQLQCILMEVDPNGDLLSFNLSFEPLVGRKDFTRESVWYIHPRRNAAIDHLIKALAKNGPISANMLIKSTGEPVSNEYLWFSYAFDVGLLVENYGRDLTSYHALPKELEDYCVYEKDIEQALQLKAECRNEQNYFTLEDITSKEFLKKGQIIILDESENSFKGTCYDRKELVTYMTRVDEDKPAVYGPYPDKTFQYFKLPYPGTFIDEKAIEHLKNIKRKVFRLRKVKKERIGSGFGISQLHGQEPLPIYTLDVVKNV